MNQQRIGRILYGGFAALLVVCFAASRIAAQAPAGFVYVANCGSVGCPGGVGTGSVSAYMIEGMTGALTPVPGSPFATGIGPQGVIVDPFGRFVYVANLQSNSVSAYTIDPATGALTEIPGSPFAAGGTSPRTVAIDPAGQFVYVANVTSNNVSAFTVDATTGALSEITGAPFAAGLDPLGAAVDPAGQFAYVSNCGNESLGCQASSPGNVSAYTFDAATGALSPIGGSPFAAGTTSGSVTVDPTGQFVYVTNRDSNDVSAFAIDATTGALTPVTGSPFLAGSNPLAVAATAGPPPPPAAKPPRL